MQYVSSTSRTVGLNLVNMYALTLTPIPRPIPIIYTYTSWNENPADDADFYGLAFSDVNTAYLLNTWQNYPSFGTHFWKFTQSSKTWGDSYDTYSAALYHTDGLASDPTSPNQLYTVEGYSYTTSPTVASTSILHQISVSSGGVPTETSIGTISGVSGVTGLVFGPALTDIVSPSSLPFPPPPSTGAMSGAWEPVRELIFN